MFLVMSIVASIFCFYKSITDYEDGDFWFGMIGYIWAFYFGILYFTC